MMGEYDVPNILRELMERCRKCLNWYNGKGSKTCLKCSFYKRFCLKSVRRSQVPIDILPDIILESFAEINEDMPDVIGALQHLPDDLAAILAMRFVADLSQGSIAAILRTSQANVSRRIDLGLNSIKNILCKENTPLQRKRAKS